MFSRQNNQYPVPAPHPLPKPESAPLPPIPNPLDHSNMMSLPPAQNQQVYGGVNDHLKPYTGRKGDRIYRCVFFDIAQKLNSRDFQAASRTAAHPSPHVRFR